jgi:hypothetical protein
VHGPLRDEDAVAAARHGGGRRPVCDYGFYAAQRFALDDWRAWVGSGGKRRSLDEHARAARGAAGQGGRPVNAAAIVVSVRRTIGTFLIGIGERVQGTPHARRTPEVLSSEG